ncbi:transglycosylase SLT domain-containing protein [Pseudooceanicola sp. C21-150M6]|uniref:transglycosylase SLT domain-containing protein n=1 Tax=Pseudooceanicola sp. C21-150M6 TaxID=3434355 RepID=UPI003D7F46D0
MKKAVFAVLILMMVGSCSSGYKGSPRNLDNACLLLQERKQYAKAFRRAERRHHVPTHVLMAMIHQESKFNGDARTPHRYALGIIPMGRQSSAYGYSQALDGTWDEYKTETGNRRAKRNDMNDATDFMGWYMNKTKQRLGIPLSDTYNQYLAYHDGHTGYARGTYRKKAWLMNVATKVSQRSVLYQGQLARCRYR